MTEKTRPERLKTRRHAAPALSEETSGTHSPLGLQSPSASARPMQSHQFVTSCDRAIDRRAWVEVNLEGILHNARAICAEAGGARLLAVVKANAYGLGAAQIARTLEAVNPWGFAVAMIDEGIALRHAGVLRPVVEDPETLAGW